MKNTLLLVERGIVRQKISGANSTFQLRMWDVEDDIEVGFYQGKHYILRGTWGY